MSARLVSARAFDAGWRCVECGVSGIHAIVCGWTCLACRLASDLHAERDFRRWVQAMVYVNSTPCPCEDPDIEDPGPTHVLSCPYRDPEYVPEDWPL